MKITIEMACSINGFIATSDGNEDFLLNRNYEIMLELLKSEDVLIWGNKTFENVLEWGEKYTEPLKDINIIILSRNKKKISDWNNVTYCSSVGEIIELCKNRNYNNLFISGGATTNSMFIEKGIVDKIILNYNPYILNNGIPLFKENSFESKLKLNKVVNEEQDIVQIHYDVIRED